ncbi:MAG: hypothetical protein CVT49_09205 [candidate division Zixibacteria bacterium HGW-Zixibacteria-1]|nr:MAG: hypothetical protein CVT49_09205 [candidate division Zixibacteria bacterium HGW-Zixibacteria-1]
MEGTRDPDFKFIFKMLYEFMCLRNFLLIPSLRNSLRRFISVDNSSTENRIKIDDELKNYIFSNTANNFRFCEKLEDIPFDKCHYFILRLSCDNILYIEVTLFGLIRNFFIIDKWKDEYDFYSSLLDRVFLFTMDRHELQPFMYPNLNSKDHLLWVDGMVKVKWYKSK